jgi:pheromone a factor receptor
MIWSALANLTFFINSIIWDGNMIDWAPTWCDICKSPFLHLRLGIDLCFAATHFLNGFNVAIPACSLAINHRLYQIASGRTVTKSKGEVLIFHLNTLTTITDDSLSDAARS